MRSSSLLILALVLGTFGCKKKVDLDCAPDHYPLSEVPNRSKTTDITCWSAGTKVFEGQAQEPIIVRDDGVIHFRTADRAEGDGVDEYVRVTGDCVARYTARRE